MIHTASFFAPDDHHAEDSILLSIANRAPAKRFNVKCQGMSALRPGKLLLRYRDGELSWEEYREAYVAQLEERREHLHRFFVEATPGTNFTLLCWEDDPNECHRKWAAEWLRDELECTVVIR